LPPASRQSPPFATGQATVKFAPGKQATPVHYSGLKGNPTFATGQATVKFAPGKQATPVHYSGLKGNPTFVGVLSLFN
jgi:hypothetical protein